MNRNARQLNQILHNESEPKNSLPKAAAKADETRLPANP